MSASWQLQAPEMWLLVLAEPSDISAVQCQPGVAPGFDSVIACPASDQMLFCFDPPVPWVRIEDSLQLCLCSCLLVLSPMFQLATENGFGQSVGWSPKAGVSVKTNKTGAKSLVE